MPRTRKSGMNIFRPERLPELFDEIEAYVHRHGTWPAAKGLELRQMLEAVQPAKMLSFEDRSAK